MTIVSVRYGLYGLYVRVAIGSSIAQLRLRLKLDRPAIPTDARPYVNGAPVMESYALRYGDRVEFHPPVDYLRANQQSPLGYWDLYWLARRLRTLLIVNPNES